MRRFAVSMAMLALWAGPAAAEKQMDGAQVYQGFALEVNLSSRLFALTQNNAGSVSIGALQGGFFTGYKISRVVVGLGFDIGRLATGASMTGVDTSTADTSIKFVPGIRVAIVRSPEKRVELFGEFDLGLGTTVQEQSPPAGGPSTSTFLVGYQIGPGVRYWIHPQFAFGALTGVAGDFAFLSTTTGNNTVRTSSGVTSIFAKLQIMGVF